MIGKIRFALLGLTLAALPILAQGQFQVRPSTYSNPAGTAYNNPTYAYDNSPSSYSYINFVQTVKSIRLAVEQWSGFPSAPPGATSMSLNISSSASISGNGFADVEIKYSLDGGTTFTTLYDLTSGSTSRVDSIPLSNNQDLTKIVVEGWVQASVLSANTSEDTYHQINDIWVSGQ